MCAWVGPKMCLKRVLFHPQAGYMLGTGVMVGLPGQTLHDLAGDVMFFRDVKADMIGGWCLGGRQAEVGEAGVGEAGQGGGGA